MDKNSKNIADNPLAESVKHHLLSYISKSEDARKAIVAAPAPCRAQMPENQLPC